MSARRVISGLAAAACLATIFAWGTSRLITDAWQWSQYPWWVPTWAWAGAAAVMLALSGLAAGSARRRTRRRPGRGLRRLGAAGLVVMAGYLALDECRVYRLVRREPQGAAFARESGLRVLFWNPSFPQGLDMTQLLDMAASDLTVVANPPWDRAFSPSINPIGWKSWVTDGRFIVCSKYPVLRWGSTTPGAGEPGDPGRAMWLEIDTTALFGRPINVWLLDLPSSWRVPRRRFAERAAAGLRDWSGPANVPDGRGGVIDRRPMTGFPAPDLVLGDLNLPRGSGSIGVLAPGTTGAYEQAGAGYVATFPREFPLVHIDQILTGPGLKATDYRVVDPQHARHLMQWARIEAR